MTYTPEKVAELIAGARLAADYPDVPTFASRMVSELSDALAAVTAERDAALGVIREAEEHVTRHYLDTSMGTTVLTILSRTTTKGTPDANA